MKQLKNHIIPKVIPVVATGTSLIYGTEASLRYKVRSSQTTAITVTNTGVHPATPGSHQYKLTIDHCQLKDI